PRVRASSVDRGAYRGNPRIFSTRYAERDTIPQMTVDEIGGEPASRRLAAPVARALALPAIAALAYSRDPSLFDSPRFWAEEGSNYFGSAVARSFLEGLLNVQAAPHNPYLHPIPHL